MNSSYAAAPNADQAIVNLIGSRKTWEKFDWTTPDRSNLLQRNEWIDANESVEGVRTFNAIKLNFKDDDYTLTRVRVDGEKKSNSITLMASDVKKGTCSDLVSWANTQFGKPTDVLDVSNTLAWANQARWVQKAFQWNVGGNTLIEASCMGIASSTDIQSGKTPDELVSGLIVFGSVKNEKKITQPIDLSCSQSLQMSYDQSTTPMSELIVRVDEYFNAIRNLENNTFGEKVSIDKSSIKFTLDKGNVRIDYEINRITGSLFAKSEYKGNSRYGGRINGQCSKISLGNRKF